MKKIILTAIGASLIAISSASSASAQYRPSHPQGPAAYRHAPAHVVKRPAAKRHVVVKRHRWSRGQRYSNWRRHQPVAHYHRYGLHRPPPGQHWIRVNNDYLLITAATGLIAGIIAAH